MDIKLLALAGIMAASMGLAACDSKQENAAEDVADAQEEIADAQEELSETNAPVAEAAVDDAAMAADQAQASIEATPTDMTAETPVDGTMDMNDPAVAAADGTVVVEEPAPAQ